MRPERAQPFAHDRVVALKAQLAQFLVQSHGGQIGVALDELRDVIGERVEQCRPSVFVAVGRACPAAFVFRQHGGHALARDSQQAGDAALGRASVVQADDLVAGGGVHAFNSPMKSRLSRATDAASAASLRKRGVSSTRSSGVSPVRHWCASHTSMRPGTSSSRPTRFHT